MTRETKIGLLVGLGFIVVFAVLLSHTPDTKLELPVVQKAQPTNPVLSGGIRTEIGRPEPVPPTVDTARTPGSSPEAEPVRLMPEDRVVGTDLLPAPPVLNPSIPMTVAKADEKRNEAESASPVAILSHRTAPALPAVEEPKPNVPHDPPPQSPKPDQPKIELAENTGGKLAPPLNAPKEYVVQSKDSLVKIARKYYQNSDPRLVQFLVKSNEGRIKNADSIVEGQKLLIPDLPPEMFERVPGFELASGPGAVSMQDLLNDAKQKAPTGANASEKAAGGVKPDPKAKAKTDPKAKPQSDPKAKTDLKGKPEPKAEPKVQPKVEPKVEAKTEPKADMSLVATSDLKPGPIDSESHNLAGVVKTDENSAPRLSLSGLVPVRLPATAASRDSRSPRDSADKAPEARSKKNDKPLRELKDAGDKSAKGPKDGKADAKSDTGKGDQLYRFYEIKANDTLGTIARKELGASEHWQEIKKLNGGIDPQKMKPGDRIKLPRKPVSDSSPRGRASA